MNRRALSTVFAILGAIAFFASVLRGDPQEGLLMVLSTGFFVMLLHLEEVYERLNALEKVHASDKRGKRRVG